MSGTILYLAIVAIWAGVLVPRWLRHEPHRDQRSRRAEAPAPSPDSAAPASPQESPAPHASAYEPPRVDPSAADGVDAEPATMDSRVRARRPGQRVGARERGRPGGNGRRPASVVAARRRLFGMLVMFVAAAATVTVTGLAAWWVALPPVGMFGGYLVLLREAARADAELRQARAAAPRAAAPRAGAPASRAGQSRPRARPHGAMHTAASSAAARTANAGVTSRTDVTAEAPHEPGGSGAARIVNLSPRRADDIYDQYTDAKLRAVGD